MGITHDLHVFEIGSSRSFKKESQKILSKKPHAIITVPFFTSQCIELTKKAEESNIPVVFIDTKKADEIDSKYSIHQNSFQSGKVAARILSQIIRTNGQFIVFNLINDINSQKNNMERESGFRTFFEKEMSIKKETIHSITVDQSKINSLKQLFEPFSTFKRGQLEFLLPIQGLIYFQNYWRIWGLKPIGQLLDTISIEGNIKLLEENKIQFIINQQPEYQGYSAVKGLFKMITEDDDTDLYQKIPIEIVVRENIE
jgi:LacI family transcriptional regulator